MAYSETVDMVKNDTLPSIVFTIVNPTTGDPVDLTGATCRLRIRKKDVGTLKTTLVCAAVDLPEGQVSTNFPSGTFDEAGIYEAEMEITFISGGVQTVFDMIKFNVREEIG